MTGRVNGVIGLMACAALQPAVAQQGWTVRDSVEQIYIGERFTDSAPDYYPSPNGKRLFFVTRQGNLADDKTISTLRIYNVADIAGALTRAGDVSPQPFRVLTRESRSSAAPAIAGASWAVGSSTLLFMGTDSAQQAQLMSYDVAAGTVKQLTDARQGIISYECQGETVMYSAITAARPAMLNTYPAASLSLRQYRSGVSAANEGYDAGVFIKRPGKAALQLPLLLDNYSTPFAISRYWISPDGQSAVIRVGLTIDSLPQMWRSYGETLKRAVWIGRLYLVNLNTAEFHPLLDVPVVEQMNGGEQVLWFPDSERVIVVNSIDPDMTRHSQSGLSLQVVEYSTISQTRRLLQTHAFPARTSENSIHSGLKAEWVVPGERLLVSTVENGSPTGLMSHRVAGKHLISRQLSLAPAVKRASSRDAWGLLSRNGQQETLADGLTVKIVQGINEPPAVHASRAGKSVALYRVELANHEWRNLEDIKWVDPKTGRLLSGALISPDPEKFNSPFPLVIQTKYQPGRFNPDGHTPTAYAAQPLAAVGFAVFQMNAGDRRHDAREGPTTVQDLDGAVDYLTSRGLIRQSSVGLIGFSNGAYRVDYALTNPGRTHFAAAVAAEGFTGSYSYYLGYALEDLNILTAFNEYYQGGGSFWENKETWMKTAPGFNLNRIKTPMLLTTSGFGTRAFNLIWDYEFFAGLTINEVPFDYLYFPNAAHPMQRPRERFESLTASVDWMRFWLKSEEDPAPEKAGRYARWRELRELQGAQREEERSDEQHRRSK